MLKKKRIPTDDLVCYVVLIVAAVGLFLLMLPR